MTMPSLVRCLSAACALALAAGCGDDDIPAGATIEVDAAANLTTTEAGGRATFTIRMSAIPTEPVVVTLTSSDEGEGTVAPETITFSEANWDSGVTVTVIGVDDDTVDGNQEYTVGVDAGDAGEETVTFTNQDDDGPGVTVTPTSGLETTEDGGGAAFTVALNTEPTADVVIPIASGDPGEGTVEPAELTFTTTNWNAPQIVNITGVDDDEADGEEAYEIDVGVATSDDETYNGVDPANVAVANIDNDSPGVFVTPKEGLETDEDEGDAEFTVRLNTQPSADVTIVVSSNAEDEGLPAPTTLTFTADNWDAPQTVTVTGVDDDVADGPQSYTIVLANTVSADGGYDGLEVDDVAVTNEDNDSPGISVDPTGGLETTEAGGTAEFQVRLLSQPTGDVTVPVQSDTGTEGQIIGVTELTFTADNWDSPQTVTVTGQDDDLDDGNQPYSIEVGPATGGGYDGIDGDDVSVSNIDDETPGFILVPDGGLETSEAGTIASFTVVLASEPTADVTFDVVSSDEGEGIAAPGSLTFTPGNWNVPQTVDVVGQDDVGGDGNQPYTIELGLVTSADPAYSGKNPPDVSAVNIDNDSPGITVTPTVNVLVSEFGDVSTFEVVLNSEPTADVTFTIKSQRTAEATVAPGEVTFTPGNWDTPQTITVTGVDDLIVDGNQQFEIITGLADSADPGYDGRNPANVHVVNFDNDAAGVIVTGDTLLQVTEAGGTATFTMQLTVAPSANVTCPVASSDTSEATVSPAVLTFTPGNFANPQTVTVTGEDDAVADGNQLFFIITDKCNSTDLTYKNVDPRNLNVRNLDDD